MRACAHTACDNYRATMRRNNTIGFDASNANTGNSTLSSYARFIIDALSDACPRRSYFRMYIPSNEPHADYERIAAKHNVESMEPDGSLWRKFSGLWRIWGIGRDMERGDVELFHGLNGFIPFGLEKRNIRSVATVHSLEFLRLRGFFSPIHNLYRRAIMLSSLRRADRIIAISEMVKHDLIRYLHIDRDKIEVIYRGCAQHFTLPISDEQIEQIKERYKLPEHYVLCVGTDVPRKNLGHLIETLPKVSSDISLVVAGRATSNTQHIAHRIKSLGLADRVTMIHGVADEDLPAIYKNAIAYLMPSLYEGFSSTIVEAITVGTPVIASKGSSLEEAGGPETIYLNPTDREAWATAIERLANDEELRQRMIEAGHKFSSRFRRELIAYNLQNCYRRIGVNIVE